MGKHRRSASALADPSRLQSVDQEDHEIIQVAIETPKGSRNKYAFDSEQKVFELKKVLPAGMAFPYDFGFIPRTKAEDGDPTDVLVLMQVLRHSAVVVIVVIGEQGFQLFPLFRPKHQCVLPGR